MQYRVIKFAQYDIHGWSGGDTAEIFCYPASAHWSRKDFEIRISHAMCRIDGAPYTDFTGYTRHISPLTNHMDMVHEGHHNVNLLPFDVDIFDGAWNTHHTGVADDINLLHTDAWNGQMKAVASAETVLMPAGGIGGIFSTEPVEITLKCGEEVAEVKLDARDFVLLEMNPDAVEMTVKGENSGYCGYVMVVTAKE